MPQQEFRPLRAGMLEQLRATIVRDGDKLKVTGDLTLHGDC